MEIPLLPKMVASAISCPSGLPKMDCIDVLHPGFLRKGIDSTPFHYPHRKFISSFKLEVVIFN